MFSHLPLRVGGASIRQLLKLIDILNNIMSECTRANELVIAALMSSITMKVS